MKCLKCGRKIRAKGQCQSCGFNNIHIDKALNTANYYYNAGLEKAQLLDLSGAQELLKKALYYNKYHIEARNLLGLVYYETGQGGKAYIQWMTSARLNASDANPAVGYVRQMKDHPAVFEVINETAKKFNQALSYAKQGSDDLALIQIKKVLSLTPKFVDGHLLLALLHMRAGDNKAAEMDLKNVLSVDRYNTTARRYLKQTGGNPETEVESAAAVIQKPDSDNLKNVRPVDHYEDPNKETWKQFVYMLIGLAIGVIVMFVLVIPSVRAGASVDYNSLKTEYNETVDQKDSEISTLKQDKKALKEENSSLKKSLKVYEGSDGEDSMYDCLIKANDAYQSGDYIKCADYLSQVDQDALPSTTSKNLYSSMEDAFDKAASQLYESGMAYSQSYKYDQALQDLEDSYKYKKDYNTLYELAMCYKQLNKGDGGKAYFYQIINECEQRELVVKAANYGLDLQVKDAEEAAKTAEKPNTEASDSKSGGQSSDSTGTTEGFESAD